MQNHILPRGIDDTEGEGSPAVHSRGLCLKHNIDLVNKTQVHLILSFFFYLVVWVGDSTTGAVHNRGSISDTEM